MPATYVEAMAGLFDTQELFIITGRLGRCGFEGLDRHRDKVTLVCGGREFDDAGTLTAVLDYLRPAIIVEGGNRPPHWRTNQESSADYLAFMWARKNETHCATVPALWQSHGKRGGMLRNAAMLRMRPELVVAFPGGTGTRDCVTQARAANITTVQVCGTCSA